MFVFVLVVNTGDPLEDLRANPKVTKAQIALREHDLGMDKSVPERYVKWISHAVHGDFGVDNKKRPVWPQVRRALLVTLRLVLFAQILAVTVGVLVGVLSAIRQYSWFDYGATGVSFFLYSLPVVAVGSFLRYVGALRLNRLVGRSKDPIIKVQGDRTFPSRCAPSHPSACGIRAGIYDFLTHAILPTLTLLLISYAGYSRFQRAAMLETLSTDYTRTARAKGISERRVILRHAFRNSLIPITTIVALDFGALFGGAIITETIFEWRGMGRLLIDSIRKIDPNILLCWLLITATCVVFFNIIADLLYAVLDPRIRVG
jgi:peptide/nickel transport system permease protein